MLHLLAESAPESRPLAYAEAVARLASVRHALRLVEPFAGGPACDLSEDERIATAWDRAGVARQHCFGRRSERLVGSTAAGVEALLNERKAGRQPHAAASEALVEQIRRELEDVAAIVLA